MSVQTLNQHIEDDTLIRYSWTGIAKDGRHTACLLAALVPECGEDETTNCPANVMPQWLSNLVPAINDYGSSNAWPSMVRRFAKLAAQWHVLDAEAWRRTNFAFRVYCVTQAMNTTKSELVLDACQCVIDYFQNFTRTGLDIDEHLKNFVRPKIVHALAVTGSVACRALISATLWSSELSAIGTARYTVDALSTRSDLDPARALAWDRLTDQLFTIIEQEIEAAQDYAHVPLEAKRDVKVLYKQEGKLPARQINPQDDPQ